MRYEPVVSLGLEKADPGTRESNGKDLLNYFCRATLSVGDTLRENVQLWREMLPELVDTE